MNTNFNDLSKRERLIVLMLATILILSCFSVNIYAKSKTNLYTPEEIKLARTNAKRETWGKQQYDSILNAANKWLSFSDEELRRLIPSADVPRAFDVHFKQCPIHADEIKSYGSYPWIIDLKKPWKVQCPVSGEFYPSNNFDPENPGGPEDVTSEEYIDTGWGWQKPGDPQKYWFVAYFNHWAIHGHLVPGAETLGKAYILTGNKKYSRKAAVILDRLAEVYPEMNHVNQSRYGTEIMPGAYHGRIVNCIWETGLVTTAARAYDFIYDGLEGDKELEKSLGKSIVDIKENIEMNLLEEAARSLYTMDGRIRGNYGMHQRALATIAVVLDNENSDKYIDWVLFNGGEGGSYLFQGMASGLINLLYRDGVGFESSPHYNNLWIGTFITVADVLLKRGINLYEDYPRMKSMFDIPIKMVMNGNMTPNIGDAGSVVSTGREGWRTDWYALAFRRYGDPEYAKVLKRQSIGSSGGGYGESVFEEAISSKVDAAIKEAGSIIEYKSENLSGYGLALLRGGPSNDPLSVSLYYGKGGGHDHYGRLNIEVFGKNRRLVPDLGYPEFMSGYHKKLCGWTGHTVSHATVMVNGTRQLTKNSGRLYHFAALPGVQYVDVSAEEAYPGYTDMYRRSLAILDVPNDQGAYILDLFRVSGGSKHHYSIHGPAGGNFSTEGIALSEVQTRGTLAGEDVPFGTLYDAPHLETPGYSGAYDSYRGSGFGYLFNVQRGNPQDNWSAIWDLQDGKKSYLRMTFIGEDHEIAVAEGEPPQQSGVPKSLKYILRGRESQDESLESTFITFIDTYKEEPFIKNIVCLGEKDDAIAFKVDYKEATDYIIQSIDNENTKDFTEGITSQAGFARLTLDDEGKFMGVSLIAGKLLEKDNFKLSIDKGYNGVVESIDYDKRRIIVRLDDLSALLPTNGALKGRSLVFSNDYHSSEYDIGEVIRLSDGRYELELKGSDFLSGYGRCNQIYEVGGYYMLYADRDLFKREYYRGMYLLNSDRSQSSFIETAYSNGYGFMVSADDLFTVKEGEEFYIYDFGIGSTFTIDTQVSIVSEPVEEKKGGFLGLFGGKVEVKEQWEIDISSSIYMKLPGYQGLEYMDAKGQWVQVEPASEGGYYIDISNIPGGKTYMRPSTKK